MYSYDDFKRQAEEAGLLGSFSDADLALASKNPDAGVSILGYKQQWKDATDQAGRAKANQGAEAIRSAYGGYSGGTQGKYYTLNEPAPIQYQAQPYQSQYQNQLDQLNGQLVNGQYQYDAGNDPMWSAYKKEYLREGDRASKDVMGQAASMTGGIPSSYAVTAAGQQQNYYNAQLMDKYPEVYQQAYNRYLQMYQNMAAMEQQDRSRWEADRNFGYGQFLDEIQNNQQIRANSQEEYNQKLALAYQAASVGDYSQLEAMGIDTANARQQTDWAQQDREQQLRDNEWARQFQIAQLLAAYGDFSMLNALKSGSANLTSTTPTGNTGGSTGSSGGSGGGNTSSKTYTPPKNDDEVIDEPKSTAPASSTQGTSTNPTGSFKESQTNYEQMKTLAEYQAKHLGTDAAKNMVQEWIRSGALNSSDGRAILINIGAV